MNCPNDLAVCVYQLGFPFAPRALRVDLADATVLWMALNIHIPGLLPAFRIERHPLICGCRYHHEVILVEEDRCPRNRVSQVSCEPVWMRPVIPALPKQLA